MENEIFCKQHEKSRDDTNDFLNGFPFNSFLGHGVSTTDFTNKEKKKNTNVTTKHNKLHKFFCALDRFKKV